MRDVEYSRTAGAVRVNVRFMQTAQDNVRDTRWDDETSANAANGHSVRVAVDTHVHVYDCFDLDTFFDAATHNFDVGTPQEQSQPRMDLLCLTDTHGEQTDTRLCETVRHSKAWSFSYIEDQAAVCAEHREGRRLYLLPGRQIVSKENIEVLGLDCRYDAVDRSSDLSTLIDGIHQAGGIPVIPWGFGKWTGKRGQCLRTLLSARADFWLADSGNRPVCSAEPALFKEARQRGVPVLAGSDPLPLSRHASRAGSFGIYGMTGPVEAHPGRVLRGLLKELTAWQIFGRRSSPFEFLISQSLLRFRKGK